MRFLPKKNFIILTCFLLTFPVLGEVESVSRTSFTTQVTVGFATMDHLLKQNTEVACERSHDHVTSISDCLFSKSSDKGKINSPDAIEFCKNTHIRFPSMLDCIEQARRYSGLNLTNQDARRFCQTKAIRYYSLIDCMGQQQSASGMYLKEDQARTVCRQMPIAFSSQTECLEQAKSKRGLNLSSKNARAYCQSKTIVAPPPGTYRSLTDCVASTKSKEQCRNATIHYPSLRDCVDQASRRSGLRMNKNEARSFCANARIEYSSAIQCVDQHYDKNGLDVGMDEARQRCQNHQITYSTPLECSEQAKSMKGLNMGSGHMYCRSARYETLPKELCEVQAHSALYFDMHSTEPAEYCQRIGAR